MKLLLKCSILMPHFMFISIAVRHSLRHFCSYHESTRHTNTYIISVLIHFICNFHGILRSFTNKGIVCGKQNGSFNIQRIIVQHIKKQLHITRLFDAPTQPINTEKRITKLSKTKIFGLIRCYATGWPLQNDRGLATYRSLSLSGLAWI